MKKRFKPFKNNLTYGVSVIFILLFAAIGGIYLYATHAATPSSINTAIAPATNLQVISTTPSQILLTWTPSTNANITSYQIYQGNTQVGTTDALTTSYLAASLSPSTSYQYSVYAQINGSDSAVSGVVTVNTPTSATAITSCGTTISSPGNYILTGTLTGNSSTPCIIFTNTNNVSLNCQNNTINEATANSIDMEVLSVNNFLVDNCNFEMTSPNALSTGLYINNSNNGAVENNNFGNSQSVASSIDVNYGNNETNNLEFIGNTVYDASVGGFGNDNIYNHNSVTCGLVLYCGGGFVINGSGNVSAYNSINGEGGCPPGTSGDSDGEYGTDDGYDLGANGVISSDNKIEHNTMENFYDTGIETLGVNIGDTLSYNNISNAAYSGIGGWWWNSWQGNTVAYNVATNVQNLFAFSLEGGIPTGQSVVYFQNNSFIGNDFVPGTYSVVGSEGDLYSSVFQSGSWLPASEFVTGNNTFNDNNFTTTEYSPYFNPTGQSVDNGDNVCGPGPFLAFKCTKSPVPTAPTSLLAGSSGSAGVFLNWSPSVEPGGSSIAGYNVFKNGTKINTTPINTTSYTDSNIISGDSYSYYVQAVDSAGIASASSNTATATAATPISPTSPGNVTAVASSATSVTVSWSGSTDAGGPGLAGYHILRNGQIIGSVQAEITGYTDTTVSPDTSYNYTVEAYDANNVSSSVSNTANVTTPALPPTSPGNVTAVASSATSVTVSWSGSTDAGGPGLAGYYVIRTTESETQSGRTSFTVSANAAGGVPTSFVDTSVSPDTIYNYTVEAFDKSNPPNISVSSPTAVVETAAEIPSTPTNVSAKVNSAASVTVSWSGSTDAGGPGLGGYYILRGGVQVGSVNASTTSYVDNTVIASTEYSYTVEAFDTDSPPNVSAASNAAPVTTPSLPDTTPPSTPTGTTATANGSNSVTISWNASNDSTGGGGISGYYILRSTNGTSYTTLNQTQASPYTDSGVTAATKYYYEVKAFDKAGNVSAASTAATVTMPTPPNTTPPTQPTDLTATATSTSQINLSWEASTDSVGVSGYFVFLNGLDVSRVISGSTSYGATGLNPGTAYSFYVVAYDSLGNKSIPSSTVFATTLTPPPAPTTATVIGTVTSSTTGKPIADVHVYTDTKQISAYTNSAGQYALTGIPPSHKFDYHFVLNGYKTKVYTETYPIGTYYINAVLTP